MSAIWRVLLFAPALLVFKVANGTGAWSGSVWITVGGPPVPAPP